MDLIEFRRQLAGLMQDSTERPFVCDGSPLHTRAFVVGLNPATLLCQSFWHFWDDARGFDRAAFDQEYAAVRKGKRGNRPRIEAVSRAFPAGACLETNIHSSPTKAAPLLRADQKRTEVFEFLFHAIRPKALFIHSAPAVAFFSAANPDIKTFEDDVPVITRLWGHEVVVMLKRHRALYTASVEQTYQNGLALAAASA